MFNLIQWTGRLLSVFGLITVLLAAYLPAQIAHANINSCSATLTTNSTVAPNSFNTVQIEVDNTDSTDINWIQVTRPSGNFTIQSAQLNHWDPAHTNATATFTNGSTAPGGSATIFLGVNSGNAAPAADWTVQVSDDPGGANPFSCSGSLGMSIAAPDTTPPVISDISVSDITTTSAVINWSTDEPSTSQVDYGTSDQYDQNASDGSFATSHSLTLTGLVHNSGYHYQVTSADVRGNVAFSADNTFLTTPESSGMQAGNGGNKNSGNQSPITVQITNPADKTPPTISLTTKLPKVVPTMPLIKGTASDDLAVVRIEYSTDGGQNWLPVDSAPKLGGKQVDFSFTPTSLEDGNYTILARAIDAGGNITGSDPVSVVIDRLQPIVGGSVINLGPQILKSDENGLVRTTVGVDQKITLSAVGGPISVTLNTLSKDSGAKVFSLTQSPDSGLWSGILSFGDPGNYSLIANATDGAGNKTSRVLANVEVSGAGKVVKAGTNQAVKDAKVTVYYLQPESGNWLVWDGEAYGQTNPQKTDKNGEFNLFLPAGKYYLKASAGGYRSLTSDSFSIQEPTPVSATLAMRTSRSLKLGRLSLGWPNFSTQKITLNTLNKAAGSQTNSLIGEQVPTFSLTDTNEKKINSLDWLGKPTVISLNATWSPETIDQLKALSQLQSNNNVNTISVGLQQTASRLGVYNDVFGLNLIWLPDPDGTLVNFFNPQSLPTNYFVDREGTIKKIVSGPLTKQELLDNLTRL